MNLQWLYRKVVPESELVALLPVMLKIEQSKLPEFLNDMRRIAAKRKIIKWLTMGKFPERLSKTRQRNRVSRWIIHKLMY